MTRFGRSEHCWEAALDREAGPDVAAHLAACPDCSARLAAVRAAARAELSAIPQPSPGMDERVLLAVAQAGAPAPRRPRRLHAVARPALAALAILAALAGAALALRPALRAERAEATVPIVPLTSACPRAGGPLVVAGVWHGREAHQFASVLARFEQRTGHQVSYAYETREIPAKLEARIKRGCAPDVALLPQPGLMAELARQSRIRPLDAIVGPQVRAGYSAPWRALGTIDGKLFGVWFKAADKSTFWYRPDAFRRAGIAQPPRTWNELLDTARRLRAAGIDPVAVAGADGWTLTDWFENVYLRSAGPARYDQLAAHKIPWTHPTVKRALRALAALFGDEELTGLPAKMRTTTFEQSVHDVFAPRARAGMVYEANFVQSFVPSDGATPAYFRFPGFDASAEPAAVVGGDIAVLFSDSKAARDLIRYLATPAAAEPWVRTGGFISPNLRLPGSAYPDALSRRTAADLTSVETVRFDLSDLQPPAFGTRAEQGMWELLQDFVSDPSDIDGVTRRLEAAAQAATACRAAIGGDC